MHEMNRDHRNVSLVAIPRSGHSSLMAPTQSLSCESPKRALPPVGTTRSSPSELSNRARNLPGSAIRALLSSARSNDPLDLGGGIPDLSLFPSQLFSTVAAEIIAQQAASALQYS